MEEEFDQRIEKILKIISDPTRRKILNLLSKNPLNPKVLAEKLEISRPAVEKHLKVLTSNYICYRSVESFPSPHFVYFISDPGFDILNKIRNATILFFQSVNGIVKAELDQIERDFVLGRITRLEYEKRKQILLKKQLELDSMQITRIWIEEAKQVKKEYDKNKSEN